MTAAANIRRVLEGLGIHEYVEITQVGEDRVFGWPTDDKLAKYVREHGWYQDWVVPAEHFHGEGAMSFREPSGVSPALQIIFHRAGFVEIDLDEAAPVDVVGAIRHFFEVARNTIFRRKTNQKRISKLLDRRFSHA